MDRESLLVELVDDDGVPTGTATVDDAHRAPGTLHRAFSVLLLDDAGRVLLQQRSAVKTRFALRWGNACCGHPAPGSSPVDSAAVRLREELGLSTVDFSAADLTDAGVYLYRATDAATGRVEHEYDHVLVGHVDAGTPLRPDPAEVAALHWIDLDVLRADLAERPAEYVPWLAGVLSVQAGATHGR
ncbi:isopentenyl-diphosphate Delta-isomerase [Virgisporangium aliadipatigenens]|uniref:Isopentenyl-diphosphate Delta-isomerase n=2 Tax=Virgisporangium aliadipatigenens TaxID=741659 RepID=A0A8J3YSV5_9ACTN|nr:isopentenyl-diphosphate Delta-isomerase [Virgisporangium aliadipatigenens]